MYLKFFLLKNRGKRSGERRRRTQQYCLDYTMPFFMRKGSRFEKHSIIKKARSNTEYESILLLRVYARWSIHARHGNCRPRIR